jgi:hypothetical protein
MMPKRFKLAFLAIVTVAWLTPGISPFFGGEVYAMSCSIDLYWDNGEPIEGGCLERWYTGYCSTAAGCGQILQLAEQECESLVYLIEEFYCEDPLEPPTQAQYRCVPRVPCPPR